MYKVLLMGCGNIGAQYDFESDQVLTHAKAFSQHPDFDLSVFDVNQDLSRSVADRYSAVNIEEADKINFSEFDCVSISSPTDTHSGMLKRAFTEKVPVVVCEKPISLYTNQIEELLACYNEAETKVLVNYFRRFLPSFEKLRSTVEQLVRVDRLVQIEVKYYRGFVNNCSHAFDLIQFLFRSELVLTDIKKLKQTFDYFEKDPTISLIANWNGAVISVSGLTDIRFPIFEIDIFFTRSRITILDGGDIVNVYRAEESDYPFRKLEFQEGLSLTNCLSNYMLPVPRLAARLLKENSLADNFSESAHLNLKMLEVISH